MFLDWAATRERKLSVHLRGTKDFYRIYTYRFLYRIIYRVLFGKRTVLVVRVRPRRSAYSGLDRW
jgi:mRNA-degrading endonuclease RelE of RelBE toxin-antitoxin system